LWFDDIGKHGPDSSSIIQTTTPGIMPAACFPPPSSLDEDKFIKVNRRLRRNKANAKERLTLAPGSGKKAESNGCLTCLWIPEVKQRQKSLHLSSHQKESAETGVLAISHNRAKNGGIDRPYSFFQPKPKNEAIKKQFSFDAPKSWGTEPGSRKKWRPKIKNQPPSLKIAFL
jgi:hypothetical protein